MRPTLNLRSCRHTHLCVYTRTTDPRLCHRRLAGRALPGACSNRLKLKKEISHISPMAKKTYWQIILITFPFAAQAVDLINSPSCRAGTYFYCAVKVGKSAPKEGKTTVRSGFLSFLWKPSYLSTDRGSPPRGKRAVSYVC